MDKAPIELTLRVRVEERKVFADLVFFNPQREVFLLYKVNAFEGGRIGNDLFRISANGAEVGYGGFLKKRRTPTIEDYIRIEAGADYTVRVTVSDTYLFPSGPVECRIFYVALHSPPGNEHIQEIRSNEVVFRLA
jgi:hypothetical protein